MTGAQSGRWVSIILENAWIECNVSAAFLTLVSASRCVAACPYLQWTLAMGLFWKSDLYLTKTSQTHPVGHPWRSGVCSGCLGEVLVSKEMAEYMAQLKLIHLLSMWHYFPLVRNPVFTLSLQSYWKRQESALISFCSCSLFNSRVW